MTRPERLHSGKIKNIRGVASDDAASFLQEMVFYKMKTCDNRQFQAREYSSKRIAKIIKIPPIGSGFKQIQGTV